MIEKEDNTCLRLFSNCKIVAGISRACICDIQRNRIYTIPLSLSGIFDKDGVCRIELIEQTLDSESKAVLKEYVLFILEHELGYYCSEEELAFFPPLPEEFLFPAQVSNAIIDTDSKFEYLTEEVLEQLAFVGCHYIQLRSYHPIPILDLLKVLNLISNTSIKSIDIVIPYDGNDPNFYSAIQTLMVENRKVSCITITGADKSECLSTGNLNTGMIFKSKSIINSDLHCGIISPELFSINIPTFTESLKFNSCLNRKISVDAKGNIKNCPSMPKSYGNIENTSLIDVLTNAEFKSLWSINKDLIEKCKDCEFRHICTDCRAFIDNPIDKYSAPLKCGYDPYNCVWEDWSLNELKKNALNFYGISRN